MVQISLQNSGGKVVFLRGFHGTPLGTNGSKNTLVTSVFRLTDTRFCVLCVTMNHCEPHQMVISRVIGRSKGLRMELHFGYFF